MKKRVWFLSLVIALSVSLIVFAIKCFSKEDVKAEPSVKIIAEKIDRVLQNQEDIIKRLVDISQELDIIRIRASRR